MNFFDLITKCEAETKEVFYQKSDFSASMAEELLKEASYKLYGVGEGIYPLFRGAIDPDPVVDLCVGGIRRGRLLRTAPAKPPAYIYGIDSCDRLTVVKRRSDSLGDRVKYYEIITTPEPGIQKSISFESSEQFGTVIMYPAVIKFDSEGFMTHKSYYLYNAYRKRFDELYFAMCQYDSARSKLLHTEVYFSYHTGRASIQQVLFHIVNGYAESYQVFISQATRYTNDIEPLKNPCVNILRRPRKIAPVIGSGVKRK